MPSINQTYTSEGEFVADTYAPGEIASTLGGLVKVVHQGQYCQVSVGWGEDTTTDHVTYTFDALKVTRNLTESGLRIQVSFDTEYEDLDHIHLEGTGSTVRLRVETRQKPFTDLLFAGIRDALNLRPQVSTTRPSDVFDLLHPTVKQVAGKLFADGHYSEAILKSCIALNNEVQQRSGRADIDGAKLMQFVFSADNPVLRLSSNADEQRGFMWLFAGVMMGLRNPNAHRITLHPSQDEAIEWLGCISALFRVLDRAQP